MGIREVTGYIAHALLAVYWIWIITRTAPQLRRGARDKRARLLVFLIKTAAIVLTTLLVGVIHFWATEWWHVITAVIVAAVLGMLLRRSYRKIVATPRHRLTLTQRARGHRDPHRPTPGRTPTSHAARPNGSSRPPTQPTSPAPGRTVQPDPQPRP